METLAITYTDFRRHLGFLAQYIRTFDRDLAYDDNSIFITASHDELRANIGYRWDLN